MADGAMADGVAADFGTAWAATAWGVGAAGVGFVAISAEGVGWAAKFAGGLAAGCPVGRRLDVFANSDVGSVLDSGLAIVSVAIERRGTRGTRSSIESSLRSSRRRDLSCSMADKVSSGAERSGTAPEERRLLLESDNWLVWRRTTLVGATLGTAIVLDGRSRTMRGSSLGGVGNDNPLPLTPEAADRPVELDDEDDRRAMSEWEGSRIGCAVLRLSGERLDGS
jgi:hypothetical protein